MATLKFWKWFRRKKKKERKPIEIPVKPDIKLQRDESVRYPVLDMVMITTEAELQFRPCNVYDDHKVKFGDKTVDILEDRPAHILDFNIRDFLWSRRDRMLARVLKLPKWQTLRVYTVQKEGETTHDPHDTVMTEEQKIRIEKMIQLKAKAAKAELAAMIMAGLKGKQPWWEQLGPIIVIAVIVFLFLFAFQIQPNM